jgi:hypothetical protein
MSKRPWKEETIYAAIEEWHENETVGPLRDYLELSEDEYHLFVTNATAFFYREEFLNAVWIVRQKDPSISDIET